MYGLFEPTRQAVSLQCFAAEIGNSIRMNRNTQNRWVTAELSDVGVRGGHCYMELIEKDAAGRTIAKLRGTIWSNNYVRIKQKFESATSQSFGTGLKVMLLGSANFHEQYGLSFNIYDIDPTFTLGDMARLRREIIERLTAEGIIESNRKLTMPTLVQRIAVISASGAAGYGDFMNQLTNNAPGFVFYTHLFESVMQGENTSKSIRAALEEVAMTIDLWDCVAIIRGGGATSDLNGFDNLELARAVAKFPLPVIVGIGHERDCTVLDEIANTRVKTPTAAAQWLIAKAQDNYDYILSLTAEATRLARERLVGAERQLSQLESLVPLLAQQRIAERQSLLERVATTLPLLVENRLAKSRQRLTQTSQLLVSRGQNITATLDARLQLYKNDIKNASAARIEQHRNRLAHIDEKIELLSPVATLRRGYSITRCNGKAITDSTSLRAGDKITTTLHNGELTSTIDK